MRRGWYGAGVLVASLGAALPAGAQSLLERTPNVTGGWIGGPNTLHFNFLHRFNQSGPPQRQVTNRPTFLLAYGFRFGGLIGAQYATRSDVVTRIPNEWELFGRYGVLSETRGHPLDVSAQLSYNHAAESVDGEVSVARRLGPVRLLGAARALSSGYGGDARYAVAGGASLRLGNWVAVSGDAGRLLDASDAEELAWGAAVQFGIPLTPHSFSVQATNTNSATLQGASRGGGEVRWGFEFTVPVALGRYTGRRAPPVAVVDVEALERAREDSLRAALTIAIRQELEAEYRQRRSEDSLRFALRDDSLRLAQQLDALRREAREDSLRRVAAEAARIAAQDSARRAAERQAAARPPVRANIRNLAYAPARIEIVAGTTIEWRNEDQVEHTVTATDRSWDSGVIRPGATWRRTFSRPGTYPFFCAPHPFMTGVVVVRAQ